MKILLSLMIINAVAIVTAAQAEPMAQAEPRVHHYDPAKPANAGIAAHNLQADNIKIAQIIAKNKTLDVNQLEAIHELTYGLDASHKSLKGAGLTEEQMDKLDAAIENLHEFSEHHDDKATIKAYQQLQSELSEEDIANKLEALTNLN